MSTYEQFAWLILPGRGAPARRADKNHHELKSFGRFWYQEIRDFLNSKHTVTRLREKKKISQNRNFNALTRSPADLPPGPVGGPGQYIDELEAQ